MGIIHIKSGFAVLTGQAHQHLSESKLEELQKSCSTQMQELSAQRELISSLKACCMCSRVFNRSDAVGVGPSHVQEEMQKDRTSFHAELLQESSSVAVLSRFTCRWQVLHVGDACQRPQNSSVALWTSA